MLFSTSVLWCNLFFQRWLRPAIWGAASSFMDCEEYATWYCSENEDMFPPLPPGLDRPMTFSSLSLPLAWLRLWSSRSGLAGHDWTAESGWSLHSSNSFACPGSSILRRRMCPAMKSFTYLSKGATNPHLRFFRTAIVFGVAKISWKCLSTMLHYAARTYP